MITSLALQSVYDIVLISDSSTKYNLIWQFDPGIILKLGKNVGPQTFLTFLLFGLFTFWYTVRKGGFYYRLFLNINS